MWAAAHPGRNPSQRIENSQTKRFHLCRHVSPQRRGVSSEEEEGEVDSEVELPRRRWVLHLVNWQLMYARSGTIVRRHIRPSECGTSDSWLTALPCPSQAAGEHEQVPVRVHLQLREPVRVGRRGREHHRSLPQRHARRGQHQHGRAPGRQERRPAVPGLRDPRRPLRPHPAGLRRALGEGSHPEASQDAAGQQRPQLRGKRAQLQEGPWDKET